MVSVGKQIKRLRTAKHMTQDELAEKLFVSRQTVSNYETGKSNPDVDMLARIAQVFETDVNCLIYGPPETPDRRKARRSVIICVCVTAAASLAMARLIPMAKDYVARTYMMVPTMFLYLLAWPVLMLMAGWTAMELAAFCLKAKRPDYKFRRWIFWGLILLLVLYSAMAVPFLAWNLRCAISVMRTGTVSSTFSFPFELNHLWAATTGHPGLFRLAFALIGAGLWMSRGAKKPKAETQEEKEAEAEG